MFTLPSEENVARCVVTEEVVKGEAEITLEYREPEINEEPTTMAASFRPM
jgi:ATP-dependent Clp protease ATP-binding subunit ClpX